MHVYVHAEGGGWGAIHLAHDVEEALVIARLPAVDERNQLGRPFCVVNERVDHHECVRRGLHEAVAWRHPRLLALLIGTWMVDQL